MLFLLERLINICWTCFTTHHTHPNQPELQELFDLLPNNLVGLPVLVRVPFPRLWKPQFSHVQPISTYTIHYTHSWRILAIHQALAIVKLPFLPWHCISMRPHIHACDRMHMYPCTNLTWSQHITTTCDFTKASRCEAALPYCWNMLEPFPSQNGRATPWKRTKKR